MPHSPATVEAKVTVHAVPATHATVGSAVRAILRHPLRFLRDWNWKAATFSALVRAVLFLLLNLRAGHEAAVRAMAVEAVYATAAAGLAGAFTQRVRFTTPHWKTAIAVWLVVPAWLMCMQAAVHLAMGTPRLQAGLVASFVFAAFATGFNWFAMSRGAFLTGVERSFWRDLLLVPQLFWQFITGPLRSRQGFGMRSE